MKLLDFIIPFDLIDKKSLYDEIAKDYKFLANNEPKMRLLVATEQTDHSRPHDFTDKLVDILPALNYQLCLSPKRRAFANHIKEEQDDLPHILEHIIIGLMMMIKNDNYHGITVGSISKAEIIITYKNKENAVRLTLLAIKLMNSLLADKKIDLIEEVKEINNGRVLLWRKHADKYKYTSPKFI